MGRATGSGGYGRGNTRISLRRIGMTIRQILRMGHPNLRRVAPPVDAERIATPHMERLLQDMVDTLNRKFLSERIRCEGVVHTVCRVMLIINRINDVNSI